MFASPSAWTALYGSAPPPPPARQHQPPGGGGGVCEASASAAPWATGATVPDSSCYTVASQPVRCFPPPPPPVGPSAYSYAVGPRESRRPPYSLPGPRHTGHGTESSFAAAAASAGPASRAAPSFAASPHTPEWLPYPRSTASGTSSAFPASASYRANTSAAGSIALHGPHGTAVAHAPQSLPMPPPQQQQPWPRAPPPALDHYAGCDGYPEPRGAGSPTTWWPAPPPDMWPSPREPAYRSAYLDYGTRGAAAAAAPVPHHGPLNPPHDDPHEGAGVRQPCSVVQDPSTFLPPPPFAVAREGAAAAGSAAAPPPPQLTSPLVCSSISEGARHLNSVRHRSAASAAAFFFSSGSPTTGAAEGGAGNTGVDRSPYGFGARRRTQLGGADVSAFASPASDPLLSASSATTTAAIQAEPCCVAALIFNTAKEVGVALCELPSLTVSLLQYGDTATFFKTTSLLHSRNPVEVLVPATAVDSELVQTLLQQHGAHMTFTSVQRCFYNAEDGVQRLRMLKSTSEAALCIEDTDRYLCVAAANAVVLYMEHVNDMHLLPGSVRVRAEALEHYMELSRTTARALQVIPDAACAAARAVEMPPPLPSTVTARRTTARFTLRSGQDSAAPPPPPPPLQAVALVNVIPRACTVMGQRYLRRTLLQPLRDRVAVQGRHDAVEWLLCEPRRLYALRTLLRHTAALDLERLTAALTHQPRRERTAAQAQSYLESLQLLWSALPHLARLQAQLETYLGPPPADSGEMGGTAPDMAREAKASVLPASTPEQPAVLRSIAATLAQCRFEALSTQMGDYLERSVLPSVVHQHEQSSRHDDAIRAAGTEPQPHQQRAPASSKRNRQRRHGGGVPTASTASASHAQRATASLLRLLRMCFLVQAPRGGELDALRTRLSVRVTDITAYAAELRAALQMSSLRLEPDPVKLYCFSYLAAEEAKAQAGPFTWRYAGGSHFALYLAALRERQLTEQQKQRNQCRGGQDGARRSSDTPGSTSTSTTSFALDVSAEASMLHRLSRGEPLHHPNHRHDPADDRDAAVSVLSPLGVATALDGGAVADSAARPLRRRRVRCGTEDLEYRCARAQECVAALLQLQLQAVQPLVSTIQREFLGVLQATVESVALLDTLLSFALYALTHQCTRPVLVELRTGMTTAPYAAQETARASEAEAAVVAAAAAAGTASPREGSGVRSAQTVGDDARKAQSRAAHHRADALHGEDSGEDSCDAAQDAARVGRTRQPGTTTAAAATASASSSLDPASSPPTTDSSQETRTSDAGASLHEDDTLDDAPLTTATTAAFHGGAVFVLDALHPSATSTAMSTAGASAAFPSQPWARPRGGLTLSWGREGCVCVVTGPNACGKTTLLRLLGQYFTLAQAGCFVPARHARLFLADRLLAHMLCDELPSITQSSFRRELMELNDVVHAATGDSVALIDELGRSTTTAQGFSLAWATALHLCERGVHAVLTTHYAGLPSLTRVQPQRVLAFHFRVAFQQQPPPQEAADAAASAAAARGDGGDAGPVAPPPHRRMTIVRFGHTLFPGPCPQRWYGLALAERLHFFEPVLALAQRHGVSV